MTAKNGILILCLFLVVGVGISGLAAPVAIGHAHYQSGRILILPKAGIASSALKALHAQFGTEARQTFAHVGGIQVITLPTNETVLDAVARYQKSGLVEFAEPDYTVYADATMPNDPKFVDGTLWGLDNYGQNGGTPHADIDAVDAWDVLTSASNIVVAVLDSGIRATHQDLAANIWTNPVDGGYGYNAFDGTNDPSDDSTSHGTMVAGVLGAVGNNGIGITGVAWHIQMMACKCLNNGSGSDSTVIACVDYALAHGARIINASFDSPTPSLAFSNAVVAAQNDGVIWVASAGNGNPGRDIDASPSYPSCYGIDNVISVAYTTRNDALGSLSNYGATNVDLAAPGDQIYTTFASSDSAYYPPSGLSIDLAGTSFSAPYVSGALALMLGKYPTENYHQIIQRLLNATDPLPSLQGKCVTGGRLDLRKALKPDIWLTATNNNGRLQMQLRTGANRLCVIQTSSDLANWASVYTNTTTTNGTLTFTNLEMQPAQFFRASAMP